MTEFKVGDKVQLTEEARGALPWIVETFGAEQVISGITDRSLYRETPLALFDTEVRSIDTGWLEHVPPAVTIDPARTYQTRDGREVRIYATDGIADAYPIHGAIRTDEGWDFESWTASGLYYGDIENPRDLIEVKPEREGWVNVYATNASGLNISCAGGYASREDADRFAQPTRIACVHVKFREGDGLEGGK